MHAHEAGALHAEGHRGPAWLQSPFDANDLVRSLWSSGVERGADGVLAVAGVSVEALAGDFGTPAYVIDEGDFRSRAREFGGACADAFEPLNGADVFYAGKAFLCLEVARWVHQEGLNLDVCSGGELEVAIRAGLPGHRIGLHGNNKSRVEIETALRHGVSRIIIDSFDEIERVSEVAAELGVVAPVLVRVTVGVEAHTHEFIATAHEDQKFGLSLAGGQALEAVRRILRHDRTLQLLGLHSHIGSQIFDTSGFEISAARVIALHGRIAHELGVQLPELDLGGGFGIAYTTEHDPLSPHELAARMAQIVERECRAADVPVPRISIEPGRAIAGPSTFTLYRVGTVKRVEVGAGASRAYVSVDGGMSDNVRTALYDANFSCTLAGRTSAAPPVLARVVGSHCESGDIVVKDEFLPGDVSAGDLLAVPGTGAYCRSLSSQYNHTPRPPVVAVRDGRARVIVRRETIEDILALDV
ncbi:MAG: diaminopimelate decarboxylase [Actinomycetota bacterium]|nr:diaminopimelate decarboxylase [Actinomycetota bacterium]